MLTPKCPLCNKTGELVKGLDVYPHRTDLSKKSFYRCPEHTNVFVGCHPDTNNPMGYMATPKLRTLRSKVHKLFDPIWKEKRLESRTKAYQWFAKEMQLPLKITHVAMFNEQQCHKAIYLLESYHADLRQKEHEKALADKWKPSEDLTFED